jgi:CubicO group peptidase (beta-lactamase class C family)
VARQLARPLTFAIGVALSLPLAFPSAAGAGVPADLDAYVARARREFRVPGIAVAVVKDGRVEVARGYGVRREGEEGGVDENTLFGIASNTKAFTCAALSQLVEEKKIGWNDRVTRHVPDFEMWDPWVTREMRIRDLVTHRSGLGTGGGDLMWWPPTDFTREEIVLGVKGVRPATSFRTTYAYNNVMYVVAGEVVARASGRSWDEFVRERILDPLGMSRTTTSVTAEEGDPNVAAPHLLVHDSLMPIPPMRFDNAAAAAGLNSSAADLARWVGMLLECGTDGPPAEPARCLLQEASIRELWSAQTVRSTKTPKPLAALEPHLAAYGLGFGLSDYHGRKIVTHTGGLPGYVSRITLVPEERLGIVVLTNQESGPAFQSVTQHVLDGFLGAPDPPVDWIEAFAAAEEARAAEARAKVEKAAAARLVGTRPSLDLSGYAGRYADPWYGEARLTVEGDHLVLDMTRTPGLVADLEHWHLDTFVAHWRTVFMSDRAPYDAYVTFEVGRDAKVEHVRLAPVSPAIDFSFDFQDLLFAPVASSSPPAAR